MGLSQKALNEEGVPIVFNRRREIRVRVGPCTARPLLEKKIPLDGRHYICGGELILNNGRRVRAHFEIHTHDFDFLERSSVWCTLDGETKSQEYPAAFELPTAVTIRLPAATVPHRPFNVVALVEGADDALKNEYIVVQSHLDGAVGTRPVEGDAIYNSADDNATGSAANLSIAEQMMTPRPRRSVIFVWDSGEEQGLWGTRHLVANPPVPLASIVAMINIDMIGANRAPSSPDAKDERVTGPDEVFLIGPAVLSEQANTLIDRVNSNYLKLTLNRKYDTPESEFFYPRTDAGPFLERNILTIGFTTGLHERYHLPADEARFLDSAKIAAIARTVFAVVHALAAVDERPRIEKPVPETVLRVK